MPKFALGFMSVGLLFLVGCGGPPEPWPVHGKVTLDGNAVPNAKVMFTPVDPEVGTFGVATTNDAGEYTIPKGTVDMNKPGTRPGEYYVRISTLFINEHPPEEDPRPNRPELVPAKYNTESTLRRMVEAKDNVFDFELTNEAPQD